MAEDAGDWHDHDRAPDREASPESPRSPARIPVRAGLAWLVATILFIITVETAPAVLDFDAVEGGLLAVAAAAAALPFGLIASRFAPLAWLVSAGSALLISRTIPVLDGDPWPWPIAHGLVLLAFVFAVALRPPLGLSSLQQAGTTIVVWLGTAVLFAVSVPDRLRAGWVVGVTAAAAGGALLRWLGWLRRDDPPAQRQPAGTGPTRQVLTQFLDEAGQGFAEAFVRWVASPPTGRPFAGRLLDGRSWGEWVRGAAPWVLAFGIFWIGVASIHETLVVHDLVLPILAALIALPIGLVRRHALIGWRIATVLAIVIAVVATSSEGRDPGTWPVIMQWVWLAMTFLVAVRHQRSTTIWVWAATVASMSAGTPENTGTAITMIVAASALVLIGDLVRSRRLARHEVERQTELGELEKARRTVLEERARIARDLHDVVAHHMSMVVVQAETAPYRVGELSDAARAELASISTSARQALTEIRSMLGVLRSDDHAASTAPQPGVDQLAELVHSVAGSGVQVELTTSGTPVPVDTAPGLSIYRIVQESLANASRHAPGAPVQVRIEYASDAVHLHVVNAAPPRPAGPDASGAGADADVDASSARASSARASGADAGDAGTDASGAGADAGAGRPGHGLVGMRERAAVVGGSLRAGPLTNGGFEVAATIPVRAAEPSTAEDDAPAAGGTSAAGDVSAQESADQREPSGER